MGQVIPVVRLYTRAFGSNSYATPFGYSGQSDTSTRLQREIPIAIRGVITQFYMKLNVAPGEGQYERFDLYINGSRKLRLEFSDAEVEKTIRGMIVIIPGDRAYIRHSGSSSVAQAFENIASLVLWTETSTESILAGVGYHPNYGSVMGLGTTGSECNEQLLAAHGGTLSHLYVRLESAPGAGKSTTATVKVNGVNTDITVTISNTATTGSDTAHSAVISVDDKVTVDYTGNGTYCYAKHCLKLTGTADKFLLGGVWRQTTGTYDVPSRTQAVGNFDRGDNMDRALASGHNLYITRMSVVLNKVSCSGAAPPGAGKSRTATLVKVTDGSEEDTAISVEIADTDSVGSDTGNVQIEKGSWFRIKWEESGIPDNKTSPQFGFTAEVTRVESTVSIDKIVESTAYGNVTVIGDGSTCSVRGFCYKEATSGDPNIFDDSWEVDGGDEEADGEFATGEFSLALPLEAGKLYRVRAFAVNDTALAYSTTRAAYFEYPSDAVARVSSIRRIYRPGLYRMELGLGDLGFDVDVSEAAIKRVPDEVSEPEVLPEEEELVQPTVYAPEDWAEVFKEQWASDWYKAMTAPPPTVSTKTTAPFRIPDVSGIKLPPPLTGEAAIKASVARKIALQDAAKWSGKPAPPEAMLTLEEQAYLLSHYKAPPK